MRGPWGSAPDWIADIASAFDNMLSHVAIPGGSSSIACGVGSGIRRAAKAALSSLQDFTSLQSNHLVARSVMVGVIPAIIMLYVALLRRSSRGPTPGFNRLRSKKVGTGKAAKKWTLQVEADGEGKHDNSNARASPGGVTWLGESELTVLEAFGDTLMPGFEVRSTEGADETVEQAVAVTRSLLFRGSMPSSAASRPTLPPAVEAYTRAIARRSLELHGRPASDIGVAGLVAEAFEANIAHEQRSVGPRTPRSSRSSTLPVVRNISLSLQVLLWLLSTRLGALLLTGRAVPVPSQSLAARHSLLKRWSVSRVGKLREAFQGIKRLSCSLYFSAHEMPSNTEAAAAVTAAVADIKTNPTWSDIRYEPQHHRIARQGPPPPPPTTAATPKPGLWSGAKVKVARAAAAVSSPTRRGSNPSSPSSASSSAAANNAPKFFGRSRSLSGGYPVDANGNGNGCARVASRGGSGKPARAGPADALPSKLEVDVVVVGSGAGGGCAAGALAAKGLKVAVLEKGGLYKVSDFAGFSEMEAYRELYEGQGVVVSDDGGMVILAGSCVGGGTTVNWTASFRTPRHVRVEWARKLGLESFELGGPFDKALDAVCERLGVNTDYSHRAPGCPLPRASLRVNQHQSNLWNGAAASGRIPRAVPRNARGCVDCGSCLHGCASGSKRSTHATWLQDGLDSGNITLIPNAKVDRVLTDAGRATGVSATVTPRGGGKASHLTVLARAVVVSGGAIHTPAILLRSGLKHPMIGRHLRLHPVLLVGGVFPEDYDAGNEYAQGNDGVAVASSTSPAAGNKQAKSSSSEAKSKTEAGLGPPDIGPREPSFGRGVMMGVYVQDLMSLDEGYGCVIEAPPAHPALMGLVLPWNNGLSHRLSIAMSQESSAFLCIGRDRSSADNRVVLGPRGDPVIKYELGEDDSRVILQGRSEMLRLMRKAGASILMPAHEGAPWFCPGVGKKADEEFQEYVDAIEALGTRANEAGLFSAHQMGSCRLSATEEGGPLRETGETWECDGLFVADASVFPTSIGINPMITVEAIAHMVADQVATRLGKETAKSLNRSELSPLRRRLSSLGKSMVAAMSRDSSVESETVRDPVKLRGGAGAGSSYYVGTAVGSPRSPLQKNVTMADDDFGVDLAKLAW